MTPSVFGHWRRTEDSRRLEACGMNDYRGLVETKWRSNFHVHTNRSPSTSGTGFCESDEEIWVDFEDGSGRMSGSDQSEHVDAGLSRLGTSPIRIEFYSHSMREERKRTLREFSYGLCNVLKIMLGVFSTVFVRRQSGEVLITDPCDLRYDDPGTRKQNLEHPPVADNRSNELIAQHLKICVPVES
ncbi:hypothetical protein CVT26_009663 [Gymnopilus dilepis]|uniref:Uncharacterized protein n=1 Tax=Gymnopilus dilepis TaxID=231916 RepID=A0A409VKS7_9AGAR|nr:hypothetical protein CVT26_009663 [Gymnopilus dilepis]